MSNIVARLASSVRYRLRKGIFNFIAPQFEKRSLPFMERKVKKYSKVGDKTFFSSETFPWVAEIENNWEDIRAELDQVLVTAVIPNFQDVSNEQREITTDDKWKTFIFTFYGHVREENCRRCPQTMQLLKKIPGMKTAFFSILAPNKHIPPHRGPYNGVLRFHLGLKIPQNAENCKIRVGNDFGHWQAGKSLLFDDSYQHEVWNNTPEERVVLFVDFLRPLPAFMDKMNRLYINHIAKSKFIKDAVVNLDKLKGSKAKMKQPAF